MHLVRPHDYNMKDRPLSKEKWYLRMSSGIKKLIPGYKGLLHFKDQKEVVKMHSRHKTHDSKLHSWKLIPVSFCIWGNRRLCKTLAKAKCHTLADVFIVGISSDWEHLPILCTFVRYCIPGRRQSHSEYDLEKRGHTFFLGVHTMTEYLCVGKKEDIYLKKIYEIRYV